MEAAHQAFTYQLNLLMEGTHLADRIKLRRDTSANWTATNPTLSDGEIGFERDSLKLKIGDGSTAWNSLAYVAGVGAFVQKTGDETISGVKTFSESPVVPGLNGGQLAGHRNKLINANFEVNQERRSGTVTLAAGEYGHDMWKGGASGCTYTFSSSGGVTTLTITAGSLVQVIEGTLLQTGTFVLGWTGTVQGKIGAGSYSASGVTASVTGGSNLNIEFNTGTLELPQFEPGSIPTLFEHRIGELYFCQNYYFRIDTVNNTGTYATFAIGEVNATTSIVCQFVYPRPMRVPPAMSGSGLAVSAGGAVRVPTTFTYDFIGEATCRLFFSGMSGMTVGWAGRVIANNNNTAYIQGSARL